MKKLKFLLIALLALSCMIIPGRSTVVKAEEVKDLDVVLVLDISSSMTAEGHDPLGMSREAANMFIEMLPTETAQVGVIAFCGEVETLSEMTPTYPKSNIDKITNSITTVEKGSGTDIGNAIGDAMELFDLDNGHNHAILFLTDGEMHFGNDKQAEKKKIDSINRLNEALAEANDNNVLIYAIGFSDEVSDPNSAGYQTINQIATSEETFTTETDASKIHEFFFKMLADINGTKIVPIDNEFDIGKYVKEANVYVVSNNDISNETFTLTGPDGKEINLDDEDSSRFYESSYSAVIKLIDPEAGHYVIETESDVKVSYGYIALYQFGLDSKLVDEDGEKVTKGNKGDTYTIETSLTQDGNAIEDDEIYESATATATITEKATGNETTVTMKYKDGKFQADYKFKDESKYSIKINVTADAFDVDDDLSLNVGPRSIELVGKLDNIEINKTLKNSKTQTLSSKELASIITDEDNVGYTIEVESSEPKNVEVKQNKDGSVDLIAKNMGSSLITVTYSDNTGEVVTTKFTTKVKDYVKLATYASIPTFAIGAVVVILVVYIIAQRRMKGTITINQIDYEGSDGSISLTTPVSNGAKTVVKKKNAASLVDYYVNYSDDSAKADLEQAVHKGSELYNNLQEIKFLGTFMGGSGIIIKNKANEMIAVRSESNFGKKAQYQIKSSGDFNIYAKDSNDNFISINGTYNRKKSSSDSDSDGLDIDDFDDQPKKKKKSKSSKKSKVVDDFDDFD